MKKVKSALVGLLLGNMELRGAVFLRISGLLGAGCISQDFASEHTISGK
jgi:hypothetical protein